MEIKEIGGNMYEMLTPTLGIRLCTDSGRYWCLVGLNTDPDENDTYCYLADDQMTALQKFLNSRQKIKFTMGLSPEVEKEIFDFFEAKPPLCMTIYGKKFNVESRGNGMHTLYLNGRLLRNLVNDGNEAIEIIKAEINKK